MSYFKSYKKNHEHKNKLLDGFTSKYSCNKLVYYEIHLDINEAIIREKELKKWKREENKFNKFKQYFMEWFIWRYCVKWIFRIRLQEWQRGDDSCLAGMTDDFSKIKSEYGKLW